MTTPEQAGPVARGERLGRRRRRIRGIVPGALPIEALSKRLNPEGHPEIEAVVPEGVGVFETLKATAKLIMLGLRKR